MSEWDSIIGLGRSQNSYGTCVRSTPKHPALSRTERHYLDSSDTLQGIALKYSTTTEELRRINKLYFSESIFLRSFLLVPSDKKTIQKENVEVKLSGENQSKPRGAIKEKTATTIKKTKKADGTDTDNTSVHDFLKKMDLQINASKKVTKNITEKNVAFENLTSATSEYYASCHDYPSRMYFTNKQKENIEEEMFKL